MLRLHPCASRIAAFSCLAGAVGSISKGQLLGPEFQVNTYTTSSQERPAVAAIGDESFVVVWESYGQDGWHLGVFGQRFGDGAQPIGSEFQVNSMTVGRQFRVAVAAEPSGEFVVAWESYYANDTDVFARRFDSEGNPEGEEFQVNSRTSGGHCCVDVHRDGQGGFVALWENTLYPSPSEILFRRFDSSGVPMGEEVSVAGGHPLIGSPRASMLGIEGLAVVWEDRPGTDWDVLARRLDPTGQPLGEAFVVSSQATYNQSSPSVGADSEGNFVVVWNSTIGGTEQGFGRRFSSTGSALGDEFAINSFYPWSEWEIDPVVAVDGSGSFLVTWLPWGVDEILGQRFRPTGAPAGNRFQINEYTPGHQMHSAVAANGAGDFVIVWDSYGQDGSRHGVWGRRLRMPYFADGFESADVCEWSATLGGDCV